MKNTEKNVQAEPAKVKKKKVKRIHVLDVLIILLVIAVCVGLFFRQDVVNMFGNFSNLKDAEVSFSVENISYKTPEHVSIDDEVYFKSDRNVLGTLMAAVDNGDKPLACQPSTHRENIDGEEVEVSYPENTRIDANGRIKCRGYFADDGSFMLNGSKYLAAGQKIVVCTELVTLEISITGIKAQ